MPGCRQSSSKRVKQFRQSVFNASANPRLRQNGTSSVRRSLVPQAPQGAGLCKVNSERTVRLEQQRVDEQAAPSPRHEDGDLGAVISPTTPAVDGTNPQQQEDAYSDTEAPSWGLRQVSSQDENAVLSDREDALCEDEDSGADDAARGNAQVDDNAQLEGDAVLSVAVAAPPLSAPAVTIRPVLSPYVHLCISPFPFGRHSIRFEATDRPIMSDPQFRTQNAYVTPLVVEGAAAPCAVSTLTIKRIGRKNKYGNLLFLLPGGRCSLFCGVGHHGNVWL